MKRRARLTVALLFGALAIAGCPGRAPVRNLEGDSVPHRSAKSVIEAHAPSLMAIPGVVGVYEGARDDGTVVIRIMVVRRTPELDQKLPRRLDGYPVEIEATGVIRPLGGN